MLLIQVGIDELSYSSHRGFLFHLTSLCSNAYGVVSSLFMGNFFEVGFKGFFFPGCTSLPIVAVGLSHFRISRHLFSMSHCALVPNDYNGIQKFSTFYTPNQVIGIRTDSRLLFTCDVEFWYLKLFHTILHIFHFWHN